MHGEFAPILGFYPVTAGFDSGILDDISYDLKQNAQEHSYGLLIDIGLTPGTQVTCCVFGCPDHNTFQVPKELKSDQLVIPIVRIKNCIVKCNTICTLCPGNSEDTWKKYPVHGYNSLSPPSFETAVDWSGYSVGLSNY